MSENPRIGQVENGTKISWDKWLEYLEPSKELNHKELAIEALRIIKVHGESTNPEWWAQSVAVTYEQETGKRIVGQMCDGVFSASANKTVKGNMDDALKLWTEYVKNKVEFNDVSFTGEPRISQTEKWRYWKINLEDGSAISVNFNDKPGGEKANIGVNHDKISTEEARNEWKAYWKKFLNNLG